MEVWQRSEVPERDADMLFIADTLFSAAFHQTGKALQKQGITYESIPCLFGRFEAFDKRGWDIREGKKGRVSLPSLLKRFMRNTFPEYAFENKYTFRKKLTDELDGLLFFEPIHHMGFGKSFTIKYSIESPLIRGYKPKIGGGSYFCFSIFELFHRTWEQPCWAYASTEELQHVFSACKTFLSSVLPILEHRLIQMFEPWPTDVPASIPRKGPLLAWEAVHLALSEARPWAEGHNFELISVKGRAGPDPRDALGVGIGSDGRLQRNGNWAVRFRCPETSRHIVLEVPHTGNFRQMTLTISTRSKPDFNTLDPEELLDSQEIATAFQKHRRQHTSEGTYEVLSHTYELDWWRHSMPTWRVELCGVRTELAKRSNLYMIFDAKNGDVVEKRES